MKSAPLSCGTAAQPQLDLAPGCVAVPLKAGLAQSYLGAWFETLKQSAHYTQISRTGLFGTEAAAETYRLFGPVEHLTFDQWWVIRGRQAFGAGEFAVTRDCLVQYQAEQDNFRLTFHYSARAYGNSSRLLDALELARCACGKLLSLRPVVWPFFRCRVSPAAVLRSLDVLRACDAASRQGRVRLYEIGERLKLNRAAAALPGDGGVLLADKHTAMSKLVCAERRRGALLSGNAALGLFPSFAPLKGP